MTREQAIEVLGGGIMSNKIHYQCSNCGKREQTSAWVGIPEGMFHLGYRAHGDVLYCPDCVETWKERNGAEYDEQYKDAQHLFAVWWNRQVQMQITDKSKIKTYRRNCVGDFVEVEGCLHITIKD
jgi:hypothetical protein